MKLISYGLDLSMEPRLGFLMQDRVVDVMRASLWLKENRNAQNFLTLPASMDRLLEDWNTALPLLRDMESALEGTQLEGLSIYDRPVSLPERDIEFFAPNPFPPALRLFQGFSGQSNFHFGNASTLWGSDQTIKPGLCPSIELGFVVSRQLEDQASIAGLTGVINWFDPNNLSDQGLAFGQASSVGPYLVPLDELSSHLFGSGINLEVRARLNGEEIASGGFSKLQVSLPDMLAAARLTTPVSGDLFFSGSSEALTIQKPLQSGDRFQLEIQALGTLETTIR